MTRYELYATLAPLHRPIPGGTHPWTVEEVTQLLHAYVADEGHLPMIEDLCGDQGLPSYASIKKLFGGMQGFYALCPGVPRAITRAHTTCPLPARAWTTCLGCDRRWRSPDPRRWRLCPGCRKEASRDESGEWMTGEAVVLKTTSEWFVDWEPEEVA